MVPAGSDGIERHAQHARSLLRAGHAARCGCRPLHMQRARTTTVPRLPSSSRTAADRRVVDHPYRRGGPRTNAAIVREDALTVSIHLAGDRRAPPDHL
jgi:hypothetical protein